MWLLQRRRGQQKMVGVGGLRGQARDEEKLASSAAAGAAEDGWCGRAERSGRGRRETGFFSGGGGSGRRLVWEGREVRPGTRRKLFV